MVGYGHKRRIQQERVLYIRYPLGHVLRYAIQAKKLKDNKYEYLSHKVGRKLQINILRDYAKTVGATPLYLFYNYVPTAGIHHWNCSLGYDPAQLGCTVAHARDVEKARRRRNLSFDYIHQNLPTYPWRCLLCPAISVCEQYPILKWGPPEALYQELPVLRIPEDSGKIIELPEPFYPSGLETLPEYIMTIDTLQSR